MPRLTTRRRALVGLGGLAVVAVAVILVWIVTSGGSTSSVEEPVSDPVDGLWISADELARLPTEGPAWDDVEEYALGDWGDPDIGDQNSNHDVHTLAGALYATRIGDDAVRAEVEDALEAVTGSRTDEILALSRNLLSYVVAADVIGYRSDDFESWLDESLRRPG